MLSGTSECCSHEGKAPAMLHPMPLPNCQRCMHTLNAYVHAFKAWSLAAFCARSMIQSFSCLQLTAPLFLARHEPPPQKDGACEIKCQLISPFTSMHLVFSSFALDFNTIPVGSQRNVRGAQYSNGLFLTAEERSKFGVETSCFRRGCCL